MGHARKENHHILLSDYILKPYPFGLPFITHNATFAIIFFSFKIAFLTQTYYKIMYPANICDIVSSLIGYA